MKKIIDNIKKFGNRTLDEFFKPIRRYNNAQREKDRKLRDSYIQSIPPERRNEWMEFERRMPQKR